MGGKSVVQKGIWLCGVYGMFQVYTNGDIIQNRMHITAACKAVLDRVGKNLGCFVMCLMFCKQFARCAHL